MRARWSFGFQWLVAASVVLLLDRSARSGLSGQGLSGQGLSGQGLSGQGLSGQGLSGQGLSGQGLSGQGLSGQGLSGQGLSGQGLSGQGVWLMGSDIPYAETKGVSITSIAMRGTTAADQSKPSVELTNVPGMSTGTGNYITVEGQSAVGHYALATMGDANGVPVAPLETLDLYIAAASRDPNPNLFHDPAEQDNEDELYTVYFFHKWSGQWISLCPYDARTRAASAMAIPEDRANPNKFIFACTATGVSAKCARNWGYRPWAYAHTWAFDETIDNGPNASPGGWVQNTEDLKPFYDLCKVAARAAYCQDDKSYTKNGTLVDLFDTRHVIWPNAFESPFSKLDPSSRWMMAQEYFISDIPWDPNLPMTNKTEKRDSALQRTRYRELSPSGECADFGNIGRLERDDIEDGRWAGVLNNEHSLQIFSPTACTHGERETGPRNAPLPWDCSPCTTKVCKNNPECCGAGTSPGWTSTCVGKAIELCKDPDETPWPQGLVWPRDISPPLASIPPKYLLGAGGAVLRVDAPVPATATVTTAIGAKVSGWACDPEWPGATVPVAIYNGPRENGGTLLATVRADQALALPLAREVSAACDGPGRDYAQHGFSFTLPLSQTGNVFVYAIDEATEDGPAAPPTLVRNGIVPVPTCPHSETVEGAALTALCSDCASSVCAAQPECCNPDPALPGWGPNCTQLAALTCAADATSSVVNEQNVAAVATGWIEAPSDGTYAFDCGADPSRLWVNGQKLCDTWPGTTSPGGPMGPIISLMGGTRYHIRWDRYHLGAPLPATVAGLQWVRQGGGGQLADIPTERLYQLAPGSGTGLAASYTAWIGSAASGFPGATLLRTDPFVDINNDVAPPSEVRLTLPSPPVVSTSYLGIWEGEVVPTFSETYTFSVVGAGIPQLFINGTSVPIAGPPGLNPPSGSCAAQPGGHSVCDVGDKLARSTATVLACDPCVDIVCAPDKDPFCCDGGYFSYYSREPTWDAKCVAEAKAYCEVGCTTPPATGLTPERKATPFTMQAGVHYHIKLQYDNSINQNTGGPPTDQTVRLLWASPRQAKEVVPQYALYPQGGTSTAGGAGLNVTYFTTKNTNGVLELDKATAAGATPSLVLTPPAGPLGIPSFNVLAPTGAAAPQTQQRLPPPILVRPRFEDVLFSDGEILLEGKGGVPGSWVDVALGTVNPASPNGLQVGPIVASAAVGDNGTFNATVTSTAFRTTLVLVQRPHDLTTCGGFVRCSYPLNWPVTVQPPKSNAVLEITSPHNSTHIPNPQANVLSVHGTGTSAPVTVTEIFDNGGSILSQSLVTSPDGIISGTITLSAATPPTSDTAGDPNTGWHWLFFSQDASTDPVVGPPMPGQGFGHPIFVTVGLIPPTVGFPRSGAHLDCEAVPEIDPGTGEQTIHIEGKLPYAEAAFGALRVFEETGRSAMREIPVPLCAGGTPCPGDRVVATTPGPDGLFAFKMAVIPGPGKHVFRVFQAPEPPASASQAEIDMHFRAFATVANTPTSQLVVNVAPPKFDIPPGTGPFFASSSAENEPIPGFGLRTNDFGANRFQLLLVDSDCTTAPVHPSLCAVPGADVNVKVGSRVYTTRARSSGAWSLDVDLPAGWNALTFSQVADSPVGGAWSESCPSEVVELGKATEGVDQVVVTPPSQNISVDATSPSGAIATFEVTAVLMHLSDAVRPVPVICDRLSGSTFSIGTTSVLCTASDAASGATGLARVDVRVQTGLPVLHLPPEIVDVAGTPTLTEEATSVLGAMVSYNVTANDVFDVPLLVSCVPSSPAQFALGAGPGPNADGTLGVPVFCEATDAFGHTRRVDFRVHVVDTTKPDLTLPLPITVTADLSGSAVVSYAATAHDLGAGTLVPTCLPASGGPFAVGITTVNCSASDTWDNVATGSFTVTVKAPNITVSCTGTPASPVVVSTSPGQCGTTVSNGGVAGTCSGGAALATCRFDGAAAETLGPGNHTVSVVATGVAGATASCTSYVRVVDGEKPVLTCPSQKVECAGNGGTTLTPKASCTDNCSCTASCATALFQLGTSPGSCTATDPAGNSATCQPSITVVDSLPPATTATPGPSKTPDVTISINITSYSVTPKGGGAAVTGSANCWTAPGIAIALSAVDACAQKQITYALAGAQTGGATVAGSAATVTVTTAGSTSVSYYATDKAGNKETAKTLPIFVGKAGAGFGFACAPSPSLKNLPAHGTVTAKGTVTITNTRTGQTVTSAFSFTQSY